MYGFGSDYVIAVLIGAILSNVLKVYLQAIASYIDYQKIPLFRKWTSRYFFSLLSIFMSLIVLPFMTFLIIIFFIYRSIIYIILKLIYWRKFKGFISGRDAIWLLEDQSKHIVMCLMVIQGKDKSNQNVVESIKTSILNALKFNVLKDFNVFLSFKRKFGYFINIYEKCDAANLISDFDTDDPNQKYLTHEELERKLSEFGNRTMPDNHSKYAEILISKKPIQWKVKDDKESYVIILRVHHSLGDGISIARILIENFKSDKFDIVVHKIREKSNEMNGKTTAEKVKVKEIKSAKEDKLIREQNEDTENKTCYDSIKMLAKEYGKMLISFIIFLLFVTNYFMLKLIFKSADKNPFHGPLLKGEKVYLYKTEDQDGLVEFTKKLKRKVPGSYFVDFVLTAFSASVYDYFEKKTTELPRYLTAIIPARIDFKEMQIKRGEKFQPSNNFTVGCLNLPVEISNKKNNFLVARLREVIKQTHALRDSFDFHLTFWGLTIFTTLIPIPFLNLVLTTNLYTMFISCLPGPDAMNFFDENPLRDVVFWIPNSGKVGVCFSCFTYDKRFQFGLVVDKALVSENDNLQEILDNITKYLKLLGDQLTEEVIL